MVDQIETDLEPQGGDNSTVISVGPYRSVDGSDLEMLLVRPDGPGRHPAVCLFFGGGFAQGSPLQFAEHAKYLSSRGLAVFLPDYRVTSRHGSRMPDSLQDAQAAFSWILEHAEGFGVDPERVVLGGGSAGAYLATAIAAGVGAQAPRPPKLPFALILLNPLLDFTGLADTMRTPMSARSGPLHDVAFEDYSVSGTTPGLPPAIVLHGRADGIISFESVENVVEAARSHGGDWRLVGYDGQSHGFFNHPSLRPNGPRGWQFAATLEQIDSFLEDLGLLSGPPTLAVATSWDRTASTRSTSDTPKTH
nr:alpha/beta hydrolase [Rhodococcus wratislaviensis]GLK34399.1 lipase [Rhodococcus wratislaviensis]